MAQAHPEVVVPRSGFFQIMPWAWSSVSRPEIAEGGFPTCQPHCSSVRPTPPDSKINSQIFIRSTRFEGLIFSCAAADSSLLCPREGSDSGENNSDCVTGHLAHLLQKCFFVFARATAAKMAFQFREHTRPQMNDLALTAEPAEITFFFAVDHVLKTSSTPSAANAIMPEKCFIGASIVAFHTGRYPFPSQY
jgi:hypothetical protein